MKNVFFLLLIVISPSVFGQYHNTLSKSEIGVIAGGSSYIGELNPFAPYKGVHLAGGIVYRYNINSRLSFRMNAIYGTLSGDDANAKELVYLQRNLNFKTSLFEAGLGLEFNYFPFQLGHDRYKGSMYLLFELAYFRINPKTIYDGAEVELRSIGTEGQGTSQNSKGIYSRDQISIPIGVGAKLSLGKKVGMSFEIGVRKTFTDYIDDISSSVYVDPVLLAQENGATAAALSNRSNSVFGQRGDASNKDWYIFGGIMLTISMGDPSSCYSH